MSLRRVKISPFIFFIIAYICFYMTMLENNRIFVRIICLSACMISYLTGYMLAIKNKNRYALPLELLNIILLCLYGGYCFRERFIYIDSLSREYQLIFMMVFTCVACLAYSVINYNDRFVTAIKNVIEQVKRNWMLLPLMVVESVLYCFTSNHQAVWDGYAISIYVSELTTNSMFDFPYMSVSGHISQSFIYFNRLFASIFQSVNTGERVLTWMLLMWSIVSVYRIMKTGIKVEEKFSSSTAFKVFLVALTSVYAFSPFILSIAGFQTYDGWLMILLPILVETLISKRYVQHFVCAVMFVFAKETAVLIYAGLCLGSLVLDIRSSEKKDIKAKIWEIICQKKYYVMLLIGVSWFYTYNSVIHYDEDGSGAFGTTLEYCLNKLNVFYVFNFTWILTLIILSAVILYCVHRKKADKCACEKATQKYLLILMFADIPFVVLNLFYFTVNHARYIDSHISVMLVVALLLLGNMLVKCKLNTVIAGALAVLFLISNFVVIDPISLLLFDRSVFATGTILRSKGEEQVGDSVVYNQEVYGLEKAIDLALKDVVKDDNAMIFVDMIGGNSWYLGGYHFSFEPNTAKEGFWDSKRSRRISFNDREADVIYHYINAGMDCDFASYINGNPGTYDDKIGYLVYLSDNFSPNAGRIKSGMEVIEDKTFSSGKWEVHRLAFKEKISNK